MQVIKRFTYKRLRALYPELDTFRVTDMAEAIIASGGVAIGQDGALALKHTHAETMARIAPRFVDPGVIGGTDEVAAARRAVIRELRTQEFLIGIKAPAPKAAPQYSPAVAARKAAVRAELAELRGDAVQDENGRADRAMRRAALFAELYGSDGPEAA